MVVSFLYRFSVCFEHTYTHTRIISLSGACLLGIGHHVTTVATRNKFELVSLSVCNQYNYSVIYESATFPTYSWTNGNHFETRKKNHEKRIQMDEEYAIARASWAVIERCRQYSRIYWWFWQWISILIIYDVWRRQILWLSTTNIDIALDFVLFSHDLINWVVAKHTMRERMPMTSRQKQIRK